MCLGIPESGQARFGEYNIPIQKADSVTTILNCTGMRAITMIQTILQQRCSVDTKTYPIAKASEIAGCIAV
jgi:hypothetical protein